MAATHRKKEDGIVLIEVLWVLAILTVLSGSMAFHQNIDIRLNRMFLSETRCRWAARAGIETAIDQLAQHGNEKWNHPGLDWWSAASVYKDIPLGQVTVSLHASKGVARPGWDNASATKRGPVGLDDYESRINPNTAPLEVLKRIPGMTQVMAKGILKLRGDSIPDKSSPSTTASGTGSATSSAKANAGKQTAAGSASSATAGAAKTPPKTEKKLTLIAAQPIAYLEQLLQVQGIDHRALHGDPARGVQGLAAYLTVRSNGKVNINTASHEVLVCLGLQEAQAASIVADRGSGNYFKTTAAFLGKYPQSGATLVTVRSRNFRARAVAQAPDGTTITIDAHLCVGRKTVHVVSERLTHGYSKQTPARP